MKGDQLEAEDFRHWAKTKTEGINIWRALMWNLRPSGGMPELLEQCQGRYVHNEYLTIEALACIINLLEEDERMLVKAEGIGQQRLKQLGDILTLALTWQTEHRS